MTSFICLFVCLKRLPYIQSNCNLGQPFWKKNPTVLYAPITFCFTGHLQDLTTTSSRAKLCLHQAHLNWGESRVHVQSPRGLKNRNSNHFCVFSFHGVLIMPKNTKRISLTSFLAAILKWKLTHVIQIKSINCKKAIWNLAYLYFSNLINFLLWNIFSMFHTLLKKGSVNDIFSTYLSLETKSSNKEQRVYSGEKYKRI